MAAGRCLPGPLKGWQAGTAMSSPSFPWRRRNESRDRVGEDVTGAVVKVCNILHLSLPF